VSAPGDSPRILFPPPFLFVGLAAVAFLVDGEAPWRLTPASGIWATGREVVGLLVLCTGLLLDFSALAGFLRAGTNPLPFRPASTIVARGPYRFTRNPMYLGMAMSVTGLGLVVDSGWLLVAALTGAIVADRWFVPREEAYLERRFGSAYLDYKRRVRRWL